MNSILAPLAEKKIIERIDSLRAVSHAQWGKMDVAQMLAHCSAQLEGVIANKTEKRGLMSMVFGKVAKKEFLNSENWAKNLPTAPSYKVVESHDFDKEKEKLKRLIQQVVKQGSSVFTGRVHPFFGSMDPSEWEVIVYKHLDHHLQQFGV